MPMSWSLSKHRQSHMLSFDRAASDGDRLIAEANLKRVWSNELVNATGASAWLRESVSVNWTLTSRGWPNHCNVAIPCFAITRDPSPKIKLPAAPSTATPQNSASWVLSNNSPLKPVSIVASNSSACPSTLKRRIRRPSASTLPVISSKGCPRAKERTRSRGRALHAGVVVKSGGLVTS